jgi:hypothetical protein
MKHKIQILVAVLALSSFLLSCNGSDSTKTENKNESGAKSELNFEVNAEKSSTSASNISTNSVRTKSLDFSSAKNSKDSLLLIKENLEAGDCCCKYYNNGTYHYESSSKSSCDFVGGTCVDASYCK